MMGLWFCLVYPCCFFLILGVCSIMHQSSLVLSELGWPPSSVIISLSYKRSLGYQVRRYYYWLHGCCILVCCRSFVIHCTHFTNDEKEKPVFHLVDLSNLFRCFGQQNFVEAVVESSRRRKW